jgi:hypothetical protein
MDLMLEQSIVSYNLSSLTALAVVEHLIKKGKIHMAIIQSSRFLRITDLMDSYTGSKIADAST